MKCTMKYGDRVLNLPGKAAEHLKDACADDLKVLLALSASDTEEEACALAGCTREELEKSVAFWRGTGILSTSAEKERKTKKKAETTEEAPRQTSSCYSGEDVERICRERPNLRQTMEMAMKILGKGDLTWRERGILLYLSDHLALDDEFILLLTSYCAGAEKKSLSYIEKTAIGLYDDGIVTVEALEAYIRREEEKRSLEYKVRSLFGFGERALVKKEKDKIDEWVKNEIPYDLIALAYEFTIESIQKPSFSYASSILENWAKDGIRDAEAARASKEKYKNQKPKKEGEAPSFDLDEFFSSAVARGQIKQ